MKTTEELANYGATGILGNASCECDYGLCPHHTNHHRSKLADLVLLDKYLCYNCFKQYVRDGLVEEGWFVEV